MHELLGMPPNHAAHGAEIDFVILIIHIFMAVLFVGWGSFFAVALFKFRGSKHKRADYAGVKSKMATYIEIAVALAEAALLIGFAVPLWSERVDNFPSEKDAVVVKLVAEQFAWNIHYAGADGVFGSGAAKFVDQQTNPLGLDPDDPNGKDDITTINQLHLPVDKPAIIHLSSKDVIHCFNLPFFRVKQDIIPGMSIPVWFTPIQTGKSEIACAQLCGLGHYRMKGFLTVHEQADFDKWMAEQAEALSKTEGEDDFWDE